MSESIDTSSILKSVELFEGLTDLELAALTEHGVLRNYAKNTVIINEEDFADSLYVIVSGKVKVYCSDKNGKEYIMNSLGEGEYFGELALLDDDKRSASVRTLEKSTFCIVYKQDFNRLLDEHPSIARTLIGNLARRVRHLTNTVKSLALQDVYGRVTKVLLSMAVQRDGKMYIEDRLTQQDIADRVGASREMVARILKDLAIGNYITFEDRHIVINNKLPTSY